MADINLDYSSTNSLWGLIVNIGILILAIKFPILFLLNGLIGVGLGLYFLITSYVNLSKSSLSDADKVLYNFENFIGWVMSIIGAVSIIIFFFLRKEKRNSYLN